MKNARRVVAGFCILASVISFSALSGCAVGYYSERDRGYGREDNSGYTHYYRGGRWYRRGPSGVSIVVSALIAGALIEALPPSHTTVVVDGTTYYHDRRYYYRQRTQGDYVVVPKTVVVKPRSHRDRDERRDRGDNSHREGNRGEFH